MLLRIPNLFTSEETKRIGAALEQAQWLDGKVTAGYQSAKSKRNVQLAEGDPVTREISEAMLLRLWQHPQFMSAALPSKVLPPLFNRYSEGASSAITSITRFGRCLGAPSVSVRISRPRSFSASRINMKAASW